MILQDKLESGGVIVLDGATGSEISRLGGEMSSSAWCALANMTHPNTVRLVHEEYLRAGADVITANTFATCRHVLAGAGLEDQTVAINTRAVELARQALLSQQAPPSYTDLLTREVLFETWQAHLDGAKTKVKVDLP